MRAIEDVFDTWETLTAMALDLGENRAMVEKWQTRRRIPQDYWPAVLAALRRKGKDLSADTLLAMHSRARRSA